jgi:hypothetical protein
VRNKDAESGLWRIAKAKERWANGSTVCEIESERQVIYAKNTLSLGDQLAAVETLRQEATDAAQATVEAAKKAAEAAAKRKSNGSRGRH